MLSFPLHLTDCRMQVGGVPLQRRFQNKVSTDNFQVNKGSNFPAGSDSPRRMSPLEAAFNTARVPWPTLGVTPLWGPSGKPHGGKWPGYRGFVMLPESQNLRIIMRHGSVEIGRKPTDQTQHHEQTLDVAAKSLGCNHPLCAYGSPSQVLIATRA